MQIGGNKAFYEFLRDYGKERETIVKKYNTDAAKFYRKSICFRARNLPLDEKAPPKNAQEAAERAAEETVRISKEGWKQTATFFSETD